MGKNNQVVLIALIVALGGFLMGFDASVISGVNKFIELEFELTKLQLGWAVSSLTLTSTLAMLTAGPISDIIGRRQVLVYASLLYFVSALGSAFAPNFTFLVIARMIGGIGVGASLIIAPMYIAEIAPPKLRGTMVSFNQLNIVVGISAAFFSNYLILKWSQSDLPWTQAWGFHDHQWRWMLGLECVPAVLYFLGLFFVPRSPRWLAMKGNFDEAYTVLKRTSGAEQAKSLIEEIKKNLTADKEKNKDENKGSLSELFKPALRLVLAIGIVIGILQQITGINSVFFYAPMIFEQSGIGTDASFVQAILVGIVNLLFTILAIFTIDRFGRKPLLLIGVTGIALCMFLLSYGFGSATYTLSDESIAELPEAVESLKLQPLVGTTYYSDIEYKSALMETIGEDVLLANESQLITAAVTVNSWLILIGILGFVASFAMSVGPVMWVLFSELFPNTIRGVAISFVGVINSAISFGVQLVFPWELQALGTSSTFLIYGVFAALGLVFIIMKLPETKGKTLEELEKQLVKE